MVWDVLSYRRIVLSALVSGTCCWHLRVLPTQERGDGHHPDAVPDSGSDWGSQRERGGGLRSIISLITMDSYALAPSSVLLAPGVPRPRNSPRLTCEGQGAGQVDQGNVIAVLLAVGVSKGEIAPVVDYCLHPQLHAMG